MYIGYSYSNIFPHAKRVLWNLKLCQGPRICESEVFCNCVMEYWCHKNVFCVSSWKKKKGWNVMKPLNKAVHMLIKCCKHGREETIHVQYTRDGDFLVGVPYKWMAIWKAKNSLHKVCSKKMGDSTFNARYTAAVYSTFHTTVPAASYIVCI